MQFFVKVSLCLIGLISVVTAVIPVEDNVLVLDDTNFDEASTKHDQMLVEFYAPWYVKQPDMVITSCVDQFYFFFNDILSYEIIYPICILYLMYPIYYYYHHYVIHRCGHCKTLAAEWIKAAKALSDSPIKLAKVDATVAKKLAETHAVQGFPTIKYFKNGKATEYNGGRTESEIVSWVQKKSGPAYLTVSTEEELMNLQEAHESFVLGKCKDKV